MYFDILDYDWHWKIIIKKTIYLIKIPTSFRSRKIITNIKTLQINDNLFK